MKRGKQVEGQRLADHWTESTGSKIPKPCEGKRGDWQRHQLRLNVRFTA